MIPLLFDQHLCIGWSVYNAILLSAHRPAQIKRLILDVNLKNFGKDFNNRAKELKIIKPWYTKFLVLHLNIQKKQFLAHSICSLLLLKERKVQSLLYPPRCVSANRSMLLQCQIGYISPKKDLNSSIQLHSFHLLAWKKEKKSSDKREGGGTLESKIFSNSESWFSQSKSEEMPVQMKK